MKLIGEIFIILGILFIILGVAGMSRLSFYKRVLLSSFVDSAGFLSVAIGVCIIGGFTFLTLKIIVLILLCIIINPLTSHKITRSAWFSGYSEPMRRESGD